MVNYENGKIYKIEPIVDHEENEIYVGSTTKKLLCQRMVHHKSGYKSFKEGRSGKYTVYDLFDKYGVENCQILLLENYKAENLDDLLKREGYYIKQLKCVNKMTPRQTRKEYYDSNKEQISDYHKIHYEKNKEAKLEYQKNYNLNNLDAIKEKKKLKFTCECGSECRIADKARHFRSKTHQSYLNNL